ncbi:hypothetical protein AKJ39_03440 [candidate division MSBL1 archaeon SCGC-AAA259J03]|uniref:Branched-chain amino acid ABC transporter permease n=1 Tax=candidate division MSBL1 archaeon SCGC-AAA259J03 TaxID=1698269 RepID=A0A656YXI0_9EURY|nr:hypothetical protein AKJ39_03440 [candidate division MSBL1 archaeon SCGC-AAA259J03]
MYQLIIFGLIYGGLLSLTALSITMIYGISRVPNFAMGHLSILGGYLLFWFMNNLGFSTYLAIGSSFAILILVGLPMERILTPLRKRGEEGMVAIIFITLSIGIGIESLIRYLFGGSAISISYQFKSALSLFGLNFTPVWIMGFTSPFLILIFCYFFVTKTLLGKKMRAVSENETAARLQGIPVIRMYQLSYVLGSIFAGLGGILWGSMFNLKPHLGLEFTLLGLTIVVVGGIGNIRGSILAGLILGVGMIAGSFFFGGVFKFIFSYSVLVVILLVRPSGLLGGRLI